MCLRIRILLTMLFLPVCLICSQGQEAIADSSGSWDEQLIIAADKGDTVTATLSIKKGARVNATTYAGVTPLMYAAQNGHTAMVNLLMRYGADPGVKPINGYTALISAIRNGHIETAEYLVRNGANINQTDNNQVTPLMYAIAVDSFYMPDMLLYYDADVDLQNEKGINALMLASFLGRYEMVISILEAGTDINAFDNQKWTALHYATMAGHTDIMDLLIVNGALLESTTSSGYTPLSMATARNNYAAARLLIGYGADVNSRISGALNPLTLALENKSDSLVRMLKNQHAKVLLRPFFNLVTVGTHFVSNRDDMRLGFSFGLSDRKYNLMTGIGYGFRLKAIQVLDQTTETEFYQFWERRHFISLSAEKAIYLPTGITAFKTGVFAGFSEVLTFGGYRGSGENPAVRLVFNPRIGGIFETGFLRLKVSYEYMNLQLREIDRGWFNVSLEFLFNRNRGNIKMPSLQWL